MERNSVRRMPRQPNAEAFYQIYSGGLRAAESKNGLWYIEPFLDEGHPSAKGFVPTAKLPGFVSKYAFTFIAFHRSGWLNGDYYSTWSPFIPGQTNHFESPADLWGHLAGNLLRTRTAGCLAAMDQPTHEKIALLLDNRSEAERLARSISLSLRNMDISVEQISEFYHEKLVNHMASGSVDGARSSSSVDQNLFAHVQSFFMQIGAVRDYLAAFCALRIGKDPQRSDSLARLTDILRPEHFSKEKILSLLFKKGCFKLKSNSNTKFEVAGWMKEITDLRNTFMHIRSYGDHFVEQMGFVKPIDQGLGLYRYVRPIFLKNAEDDVLDVVLGHYQEMISLCHTAALASGNDLSVMTISSKDIISVNLSEK